MKLTSDGGGIMCETGTVREMRFAALSLLLTFVFCCALSSQAADKGKVVFTSDRTGSWQVYTMNTDGTDQFQVTNLAPTDDDAIFPSLSPDGQRIAFNYNAGEGPDLFIINADGSGLHPLTDDHGSFWARWSPDGKRIVFSAFAGLRSAVIATMAADGSGTRNILTTDLWESVGGFYTPDGKHIIFGSQMGGYVSAAWIMNADGSHQRRLTPAVIKAQPWGVSPDGKHIVGYTNQDTPAALPSSIFVMNLDGSGRKLLAVSPVFHHDIYPSYSPDGGKISFISDRFASDITEFTLGTLDILNVDADGSNVSVAAAAVGSCPFDGNCVTPLSGPSPQQNPETPTLDSHGWQLEEKISVGGPAEISGSPGSNTVAPALNSCPAVRCGLNHTQGTICGARLCSIPGFVRPIWKAFDRTYNRACYYGC